MTLFNLFLSWNGISLKVINLPCIEYGLRISFSTHAIPKKITNNHTNFCNKDQNISLHVTPPIMVNQELTLDWLYWAFVNCELQSRLFSVKLCKFHIKRVNRVAFSNPEKRFWLVAQIASPSTKYFQSVNAGNIYILFKCFVRLVFNYIFMHFQYMQFCVICIIIDSKRESESEWEVTKRLSVKNAQLKKKQKV